MTPIEPPAVPLTDGVVTMRLRKVEDLDAIAKASRDSETGRWLDDEPMDEAARAASMERVEEAWRLGTAAPRAVELVTKWAFEDLGLNELLLEAHPDNAASIRVAQKAGFADKGAKQAQDGTVTRVFVRRP